MSKDIRSYFMCQGKVTGSSPTINNGKKGEYEKDKKKKRTLIVSDSDEDSDVVQSPLKKSKQNEKQPPKKNPKEEEKSKYFSAKASDIFGSAPVKQLSKNFPVPTKKVIASPTVDSGIESQDSNTLEMHDNDEFEAVLSQLDEQDWTSPTKPSKTKSPQKETSPKSTYKSPSEQSKLLKTSPIIATKKTLNNPKVKTSPLKSDLKSTPSKSQKLLSPLVKSPVSSKSKILDSKSPISSRSNKSTEKKLKSPIPSEISPSKNSLKRSPPFKGEVSKVPKLEDSKVEKIESKEKSSKSFYSNKESSQTSSNSEFSSKQATPQVATSSSGFTLWVDKYKPKTTKQIVGQQGDKSVVNKLTKWLKNWHINQSGTKKLVKPSPWAKDDDGAYFKAALLSGPPGIGKTTTVSLVCQELGFDLVEFNASDTRSKRLLQEEVSQLLSCASLTPFFSGEPKKGVTHKHVLVMDEVDGMAGNEDRGGVQELIQLIKAAKVPVICMCNDRSHPKIRSLVNYCFDLPVHRPRLEQIRAAMMSICFKENIKVSPQVMADIITNSNQDIRATLNQLSMLSAHSQSNTVQSEAKNIKL
ncbi:hypothetical protein WDU94_005408, partial [Cyamophila willieti]